MGSFDLLVQNRENPLEGPSEVSLVSPNEPFSSGVLGALAVKNFALWLEAAAAKPPQESVVGDAWHIGCRSELEEVMVSRNDAVGVSGLGGLVPRQPDATRGRIAKSNFSSHVPADRMPMGEAA
jgi:hypothetical protein